MASCSDLLSCKIYTYYITSVSECQHTQENVPLKKFIAKRQLFFEMCCFLATLVI
nr:MAG TPA: hypothetical protein [Caudoviricetes sp.]